MADIVEGFRKVIQDLLVPELKAVQVEIKHLNDKIESIEKRIDLLQEEMNKKFEAVDKRFEVMISEMQELKIGQREIIAKLDIDKRISRLEIFMEEIRKQKVAN